MSTFPDQLRQYGGVPVGSGNYRSWWDRTTYFVDNDNGNDGNTGKKPGSAFQNLKAALDVMQHDDVVYIKPREIATTSDTDNAYIIPATAENWATTITQYGISIIGAGSNSHLQCNEAAQYRVYLRGHGSVTSSHVLSILGAMTNVENIAFHRGGMTGAKAGLAFTGSPGTAYAGTVNNCLFRWFSATGSTGIYIEDAWYMNISNSIFYSCKTGIHAFGSNATMRSVSISNCEFKGAATSRAVDIEILGSGTKHTYIDSCRFGITPTAGNDSYIEIGTGDGMISNCYAEDANVDVGTTLAGGEDVVKPATVIAVGCHDESNDNWGVT